MGSELKNDCPTLILASPQPADILEMGRRPHLTRCYSIDACTALGPPSLGWWVGRFQLPNCGSRGAKRLHGVPINSPSRGQDPRDFRLLFFLIAEDIAYYWLHVFT